MELLAEVEVVCPYCGGSFVEEIDTSQGSHILTEDCSVCCRPMEIRVDCKPGEVLAVDVER